MYKKHKIENITRTELELLITENIIGFKASRNKEIMIRRLCDGLTFEELSEEFDMSVMQIKNIIYKNLDVISRKIEVRI
jgi:Mor family transcriptional regulator